MDTQTSSGLNETNFLDEALALASREFCVFPLPPGAKYRKPDTPKPQEATTDTNQIVEWWTETPDANIAIATGAQADLLIISVFEDNVEERRDEKLQGGKLLSDLEARHSPLPETLQASLSERLRFLYFRYPAELESIKGSFGANIWVTPNLLDKVGYIAAPPSIVQNTRCEWVNDRPLADLPEWAMLKLAFAKDSRVNPNILARRPLDPEVRSEILDYFQDNKLLSYRIMELDQPHAYWQGRPVVSCGQNEFYRAMRSEEINSDYADLIEAQFALMSREDWCWNCLSLRELPDDLEELQKWIKLHIGRITKLHAMLFTDWSYPTLRNVVVGRGTKQNEQELRARLERFRQRKRHELRAQAARDKKAAPEKYRRGGLAKRQQIAAEWREKKPQKIMEQG